MELLDSVGDVVVVGGCGGGGVYCWFVGDYSKCGIHVEIVFLSILYVIYEIYLGRRVPFLTMYEGIALFDCLLRCI